MGWDSAGVTTGPVTVPLVLAMGLGLGNAVSAVEGFGILSREYLSDCCGALDGYLYQGQGVNGPARRRSCLRIRKEKRYVSKECHLSNRRDADYLYPSEWAGRGGA